MTQPEPPRDVRTAFVLWLGAIAASVVANLLGLLVVEEVLAATVARAPGTPDPEAVAWARLNAYSLIIGVTLLVLGVGLFLATRMRSGVNWARIVLTVVGAIDVLIGVLGLIGGSDVPGVEGAVPALLTVLTVVELALVAAAIWCMYRPPAAAYFR